MNFEIILSYIDWYNKENYIINRSEFEYRIFKNNELVFFYDSRLLLIQDYIKNYYKMININNEYRCVYTPKIAKSGLHTILNYVNSPNSPNTPNSPNSPNSDKQYIIYDCKPRGITFIFKTEFTKYLYVIDIISYNMYKYKSHRINIQTQTANTKYINHKILINNKYELFYYSNFFHLI